MQSAVVNDPRGNSTVSAAQNVAELARLQSGSVGAPVGGLGLRVVTNASFRVAVVAAEPPALQSLGKPLLDLVCAVDRHALRQAAEACISGDTTEVFTLRLPCSPSTELAAMLWAVDLADGTGLVLHAGPRDPS